MTGNRLSALFAVVLIFTLVMPAQALAPQSVEPHLPQHSDCLPGQSCTSPDGLQYMLAGPRPDRDYQQPLATGGPDDFGYTWDDSVPYAWVSATTGTRADIDQDNPIDGPVNLPFSFSFYGDVYSSVYITSAGYLGFTPVSQVEVQGEIPDQANPNNIIAPFWQPNGFANTGVGVYYLSGGTAPNRYFAVEWHLCRDICPILRIPSKCSSMRTAKSASNIT